MNSPADYYATDASEKPANALQATGLECIRNDLTLFSNLEIKITAGEILQVDGPNGSGKTSLLRILCGLAQPHAGKVFWNGQDITESNSDYLAELNYVGHSNGIKAELTPLENISVAQALSVKNNKISAIQILNQMGIAGLADIPTGKLSSGQRKRVALARLLVTRASLWILDEPFTALDDSGKELVQKLIDTHAGNQGITVVVTHEQLNISADQLKKINL